MATFELDGKEYEYTVLDGTAATYGMATSAVDIYTEKYSGFEPNQKVQVKWATAGSANVVGGMVTFIQEDDKYRAVAKIGGSYVGGIAAVTVTEAAIAFAAGLGATLSVPVVIGIGITAGVVLSVAGTESAASLYDMVKTWFGYGIAEGDNTTIDINQNGTTISTTNSLQTFLDNDNSLVTTLGTNGNWDIHATIPSVSNPESYAEQLKYDINSSTATIKTQNQTTEINATKAVLEKTTADTLVSNGQTFNIQNLTPIQLRNAIDGIDKVSFLLSNILIKVGEQIDLGAKGIYTVKAATPSLSSPKTTAMSPKI